MIKDNIINFKNRILNKQIADSEHAQETLYALCNYENSALTLLNELKQPELNIHMLKHVANKYDQDTKTLVDTYKNNKKHLSSLQKKQTLTTLKTYAMLIKQHSVFNKFKN